MKSLYEHSEFMQRIRQAEKDHAFIARLNERIEENARQIEAAMKKRAAKHEKTAQAV